MFHKVETIMTKKVVTVDLSDDLAALHHIINNASLHHIVVMDGKRLAGIVSDRDILRHTSPYIGTYAEQPRDQTVMKRKVHTMMTRSPFTIGPDEPILQAAELILEKKVSCLPVVDGERNLLGIVTWRDILKHCIAQAKQT